MPYSKKRKFSASAVDPTVAAARRAKALATRRFNAPIRREGRAASLAYLKRALLTESAPEVQAILEAHNIDQARLMKIMGKGGYWGRKIGGWLGGLTGNRTIKGWAEQIGDYAGDLVADKIPGGALIADAARDAYIARGTGAYSVQKYGHSVQPGTFAAGDVEQVHLQHREFLGPINGSQAFNLLQLVLNPGSAQTFPQLSRIAMFYEQYRFNGLIFWYHSTSGESTNSADTAIGEVMMANMPDSTEQTPVNKQQLVRLDMAKQAKPSLDQMHGIECADAIVKYIRHGDKSEATQDSARFDMGKFFVATEGMNALTTRIGELWVTYDVTLIRSRDSKGAEVMCSHYSEPTATATNLFSNGGVMLWDNIGLSFLQNTVYFPQYVNDGDYMVTVRIVGLQQLDSAFNCRAPAIAALTNCSQLGTDGAGDSIFRNFGASGGDASTGTVTAQYFIRLNAPGTNVASIRFDTNSVWTNGASSGAAFLQIVKVPQGFLGS